MGGSATTLAVRDGGELTTRAVGYSIAALAPVSRARPLGPTNPPAGQTASRERPPARNEGRRLIREVVIELAKQGKAVIVAHAASIPLAGMTGVLRVLITAPEIVRARRLELDVRIVSEHEALATIQDSDRARLNYLRDFYGVDAETPTLYDLVLNTEVLSVEAATNVIVAAATRS